METFGAAELGEREVRFRLSHCVGVGPKGERGVRVAELVGDPAHGLASLEREGRPRVPRCVQREWSEPLHLGTSAEAIPLARKISLLQRGAHVRTEDPLGDFAPASGQHLPPSHREKIE